ncbi:hypothetical protein [Microlunatus elymi]|uniref:hypothetical protein n=1 Tax=Microlunatus elymi TaxID=2596828 RepID=UPI001D1961FD|nr:hypothetical protein [Microlunatus elymi]
MSGPAIDRQALVDRHRVVMREIDPRSPLSVGNGEFCFTADVTGLQTFPDSYPVGPRDSRAADGTLLGTQSQWGWHEEPADPPYELADSLVSYQSRRGPVSYVDLGGSISGGTEQGTPENELWLRGNPHRLHLGMIGFVQRDAGHGRPIEVEQLSEVEQTLDLWRGMLTSRFALDGRPVQVTTVCDPDHDLLAVVIESPALIDTLAVQLAFPYGNQAWHDNTDWNRPTAHRTELDQRTGDRWTIRRTLDQTRYQVDVSAPAARLTQTGPHQVLISTDQDRLELIFAFGTEPDRDPVATTADKIIETAGDHWRDFWTGGAAVELAHIHDRRAVELERRIVLSQYLTAINCAGSLPPAETGLVCNSWRGKFHLEMHWWHAAHFPLWGRPELLRRSLGWYAEILPQARETATRQGFPGVRWPKQVGPEGRESPSSIGPFLIWQQPHPMYLAELIYRATGDREVLEEFAEIVFETADFMAGYAVPTEAGFELGPPLVPAQESYGGMRAEVINPTYELVYWHWALRIANQWRTRLGQQPEPYWQQVADGMVEPTVRDGRYEAIGVEPWTKRSDHPSMLCALGVLPKTDKINSETMAATLDAVLADWDWKSTWGWDYPVIAMCAARLGRPELAVDALLMGEEKNTVLPNGHNRQTASLPLYLPGNGGLLTAIAVMAGGWDACPARPAPGFPENWDVRVEGIVPAP